MKLDLTTEEREWKSQNQVIDQEEIGTCPERGRFEWKGDKGIRKKQGTIKVIKMR